MRARQGGERGGAISECGDELRSGLPKLAGSRRRTCITITCKVREADTVFLYTLEAPRVQGKHVMREVGVVRSIDGGPDDDRTLASLKFQIGDYVDVALTQG